MKYLLQLGVIIGISFVAELLYAVLPFPVPASVYGLVILFTLLMTKAIKLSQIEESADFILAIMPIFFIEPSVKLMTAFGIIKGRIPELLLMCFLSTAVVIFVTGKVAQIMIKRTKKKEGRKSTQIGAKE